MPKEQIFMQYFCAACDCIFLDKNVKGRMTPIKGCYCPGYQAKGFKNSEAVPEKKLSEKQKEVLKKNKFRRLKNSSKSKKHKGEDSEANK